MLNTDRAVLGKLVSAGVLLAAGLIVSSCATPIPRSSRRNFDIYRSIVVLPVADHSNDLTAPILIRYFLAKQLKSKGFTIAGDREEVDQHLREIGVTDGNQIDPSVCQRIGSTFGAGGVLRATLESYSQDLGEDRTVLQAHFEWVDTQSGRVLWEHEVHLERSGLVKVPVRMTAGGDWTDKQIRSVAKSRAGKLPKKAVSQAMGELKLKSVLETLR